MRVLVGHNWPGNIRQPRNLVERFVVTVDSQVNHANDLPDETRSVANGVVGTMAQAVEDAEKRAIRAALSECDNHRDCTQNSRSNEESGRRRVAQVGHG